MAETGPIGFDRLFDFSNQADLEKAISLIKEMDSIYDQLGSGLLSKLNQLKEAQSSLINMAKDLQSSLSVGITEADNQKILKNEQLIEDLFKAQKKLNEEVRNTRDTLKETNEERNKVKESSEKLVVLQKEEIKLTEKLNSLKTDEAKANAKLRVEINNLNKELKEEAEGTAGLTKLQKDEIKLKEQLEELNSSQAQSNAKLKIEIQEKNKAIKEAAKESLGLITVYQKESKRLNDLRNDYKDAALIYGETSDEAEKLKKETNELSEALKRIDKNVGQGNRDVGLYSDALEEAGLNSSTFAAQTEVVAEGLQGVGGAGSNAVGGVKSFAASLKALLANPIVLLLAAIAGALKLLFDGFQKTAIGAKFFAQAGALVDGVLVTISTLAKELAEVITPLFDDPLGSIKEFGNFIVENITKRFEGVIKLSGLLGKAFNQLVKGEFSALKDTALEAGSALIQIQTGFDEIDQQKIANKFSQIADQVQSNTSQFIKLAEAQRAVRIENRQLEKDTFSLIAAEEQLEIVRDDATRGFLEREAAAELLFNVTQERAEKELKIAKNRLSLINQEVKIRTQAGEDSQDLLDEQLAGLKELEDAERAFTNTVLTNEKERNQLRQDRLERDLDFAIDAFDNQKAINERLISDEEKTLSERRAILQETVRLADESFLRQEEILTDLSNAQVDATELLNLDALALTKRVRELEQSEIVEGRTLEVIRERRTVLQDLAEATKELDKVEREREQREKEASQAIQDIRIESFIAQKDLQSQIGEDRLESLKSRIEAEIKFESIKAKRLLENDKLLINERVLIQEELESKISEITKKGAEDRSRIRQEEVDKFISAGLDTVSAAQDLADQLFSNSQDKLDREKESIDEREEEALEKEGITEESKIALQQKFEAEREKIREKQIKSERKQAILSKAIAAVEIISSTGVAILKAVAASPLTGGLPFSAIVGGIGALQLATVLAAPIPQFAKGTSNAPKGSAIVDELGAEIIYNPRTKKVDLGQNKGPRLVDLEGGEVIMNHVISNRLKKQASRNASEINAESFSATNQPMGDSIHVDILNNLSPLVDRISNIPLTNWNVQHGELNKSITKGRTTYEAIQSENRDYGV